MTCFIPKIIQEDIFDPFHKRSMTVFFLIYNKIVSRTNRKTAIISDQWLFCIEITWKNIYKDTRGSYSSVDFRCIPRLFLIEVKTYLCVKTCLDHLLTYLKLFFWFFIVWPSKTYFDPFLIEIIVYDPCYFYIIFSFFIIILEHFSLFFLNLLKYWIFLFFL